MEGARKVEKKGRGVGKENKAKEQERRRKFILGRLAQPTANGISYLACLHETFYCIVYYIVSAHVYTHACLLCSKNP